MSSPAPASGETGTSRELTDLLRAEIAAHGGVIPLARFLERALYEPGLGYYERDARRVGRAGDFYTSVSVGPVFGELLAFQFAAWFDEARQAEAGWQHLELLEAGAHDGRLAKDIVTWLRQFRPDLAASLRLGLIEPSPARRGWQREMLAPLGADLHWLNSPAELPPAAPGTLRVLYANELLDAFPAHRLAWNAGRQTWQELGVAWAGDRFEFHPLTPPTTATQARLAELNRLPAELRQLLTDGFAVDCQPAAEAWWHEAARHLGAGWLVTCDYGLTAEEFLLPQRRRGTLRAYRSHRHAEDPLANPGEQDLTVHVDFSALRQAGEAAGLATRQFTSQRRWLTEVLAATQRMPAAFPGWTSGRVRQFQTLTHPEHLGRAFSVLVQQRRVPGPIGPCA